MVFQGVLVGVLLGPAVSYIVEVSHQDVRGSMTGGEEQLNENISPCVITIILIANCTFYNNNNIFYNNVTTKTLLGY